MDNPEELTVLSLCSGGAGLDLGVKLAIPTSRVVCWSEWEAFAAAELVRRMEEGELDAAPCWSDLRTFDGKPWRGAVDCVVAGYPCQPFSTAGRRGGEDDPRHLWPHVRRIVEEVQPAMVFFENVSGHLSLGFREVIEDLERLDFEVAATLVQASEVGASHRRERLFILGVADASKRTARGGPGALRRAHGRTKSASGNGTLEHTNGTGLEGRSVRDGGRTDERAAGAGIGAMGHASGIGQRSRVDGADGLAAGEGSEDSGRGRCGVVDESAGLEAGGDADEGLAHLPRMRGEDLARHDNSLPIVRGDLRRDSALPASEEWATPNNMAGESVSRSGDRIGEKLLAGQAQSLSSLPAPVSVTDGQPSSETSRISRPRLNPVFVAWLMNWPATALGYSDFSEMESCRFKLPTHSVGCGNAWFQRMQNELKRLVR